MCHAKESSLCRFNSSVKRSLLFLVKLLCYRRSPALLRVSGGGMGIMKSMKRFLLGLTMIAKGGAQRICARRTYERQNVEALGGLVGTILEFEQIQNVYLIFTTIEHPKMRGIEQGIGSFGGKWRNKLVDSG
jgi:hypothetical protein